MKRLAQPHLTLALVFTSVFIWLVAASPAWAITPQAPAGAGTEGDPYEIATLENLMWLSVNQVVDAHCVQTADIDAAATETSDPPFRPIGTRDVPFNAGYDGGGHTISHLYIHRSTVSQGGGNDPLPTGLFGAISSSADLREVHLREVDYKGIKWTGGLVGYAPGGNVEKCSVTGSIDGSDDFTGGLLGHAGCRVFQSYAHCDVSGAGMQGGLAGHLGGDVSQCYAKGTITGTQGPMGGFAATINGEVEDSYTMVEHLTQRQVHGGFVGHLQTDGRVTLSYNLGVMPNIGIWDQTDEEYFGFVGRDEGITYNCYAPDVPSRPAEYYYLNMASLNQEERYDRNTWNAFLGDGLFYERDVWTIDGTNNQGLPVFQWEDLPVVDPYVYFYSLRYYLGSSPALTMDSVIYHDGHSPVLEKGYVINETGNPTVDDRKLAPWYDFHSDVDDLKAVTRYYVRAYIRRAEGIFYSEERSIVYPIYGTGHPVYPLEIDDMAALMWVMNHPETWGMTFELNNDIDASVSAELHDGAGWKPIGNAGTPFTGHFKGKGHVITGLTMNRPGESQLGLFGKLSGATVENLGLLDADITGGNMTGALVGEAVNSTIADSFTTGSVTGGMQTGGLVGKADGSTLRRVYSQADVTAESNGGGLVGAATGGLLTRTYSSGAVTGTGGGANLGGLLGSASETDVQASFWDTQSSQQASSAGGTGQTTAAMHLRQTFLDAGWDLVGETDNGRNSYWVVDPASNGGYPSLTQYGYQASPVVTTQEAREVTTNSAVIHARVNYPGNPSAHAYGICWNTTGQPTLQDAFIDEGSTGSSRNFQSTMTGLQPETTYYVRAYATSSLGTTYAGEIVFQTDYLATLATGAATGVTPTSATFHGELLSLGKPNPTAHGFCWNTTGEPTLADDSVNLGASATAGAFSREVTGLEPLTPYYVRAYATNAAGTAYGPAVRVATHLEPLAPEEGDGSAQNPYQLTSRNHLYWLSQTPDAWDKHFIQGDDIDLKHSEWLDGEQGLSPIGTFAAPFTGTYDGGGHVIRHLGINRPQTQFVGFFGVTQNATIRRLGLRDLDFTGGTWSLGGLVAHLSNSTVEECFTHGTLEGPANAAGGLVAYAFESQVHHSYSRVEVTSSNVDHLGAGGAGGLVGFAYYSTFTQCYSAGTVSANATAGGFCGRATEGDFTACFWDEDTAGVPSSAAGQAQTTMRLLRLWPYVEAGWDFAGETANGTENSWDIAHDFSVNANYPHLSWQNAGEPFLAQPAQGDGSAGSPWVIRSLADLFWLSQYSPAWRDNFVLANDIQAEGTSSWYDGNGFLPIGTSLRPFRGAIDGAGHQIVGLHINRPDYREVGLVGYTFGGYFHDLGLEDADVSGGALTTGALVSYLNEGTVERCYAKGRLNGGAGLAGGLFGYVYLGSVADSFSGVDVDTATDFAGGLGGGSLQSSISRCYSMGAVTVTSGGPFTNVGGLLGSSMDSTVTASFWDVETSGQAASAAGVGQSTAAMTQLGTYTSTGWDFLGEDTNGTDDAWAYNAADHGGYPFLNVPGAPIGLQPPGAGTGGDPYLLSDPRHFYWLSTNSHAWDKHFRVTAPVDLSDARRWDEGKGWLPIGNETAPFTGIFDGERHHISNLYINRPSATQVGFFGHADSTTLSDISLRQVEVTGGAETGGLAGRISNCFVLTSYSLGKVTGTDAVGGLAGVLETTGVNRCFSRGQVIAGDSEKAGGFAGVITEGSVVLNAYARGSVSAGRAGTFMGYLQGEDAPVIDTCYAAVSLNVEWSLGMLGQVDPNFGFQGESLFSNSFYRNATSSSLFPWGNAQTAEEMRDASFYAQAGWDLQWETANGVEDLWRFDPNINGGFPFLNFELEDDPSLELTQYQLNVTVANGQVSFSPSQATYEYLQPVTVQASADPGFEFLHWTGDDERNASLIDLIVEDHISLEAVIEPEVHFSGYVIDRGASNTHSYWQVQSEMVPPGHDTAMASTNTTDSLSWFEIELTGPGTLSYWYRVDSNQGYDFLAVRLDDQQKLWTSGQVDWQQRQLDIPAGTHTVRWIYNRSRYWDGDTGDVAHVGGINFEPATFDTWEQLQELPEDRRGPMDKNGPLQVANQLAYAMGKNPMEVTPEDMPQMRLDPEQPDHIVFTYTQGKSTPGVTMTIMGSTDLSGWHVADIISESVLSETDDSVKKQALIALPQGIQPRRSYYLTCKVE